MGTGVGEVPGGGEGEIWGIKGSPSTSFSVTFALNIIHAVALILLSFQILKFSKTEIMNANR